MRKTDEIIENIYNLSVVLDNFCNTNSDISELKNIHPIVKHIKDMTDKLLVEIMRREEINN